MQDLMEEDCVLAVLTHALVADLSAGFVDAKYRRHAADVTHALLQALDAAYKEVRRKTCVAMLRCTQQGCVVWCSFWGFASQHCMHRVSNSFL